MVASRELRIATNEGMRAACWFNAAVAHFNIADFVMLKAVFASAQELKVPVIVGLSEGERKGSIAKFEFGGFRCLFDSLEGP